MESSWSCFKVSERSKRENAILESTRTEDAALLESILMSGMDISYFHRLSAHTIGHYFEFLLSNKGRWRSWLSHLSNIQLLFVHRRSSVRAWVDSFSYFQEIRSVPYLSCIFTNFRPLALSLFRIFVPIRALPRPSLIASWKPLGLGQT